EALTQIAWTTEHRWTYDQGFVLVRDLHYAARRPNEPLMRSLRRWAHLTWDELYTLDVLGEIASQSYQAHQTTVRVLGEIGAMERYGGGFGPSRGHLTFWNSLTPTQRAAARRAPGLPFRVLNADQQRY